MKTKTRKTMLCLAAMLGLTLVAWAGGAKIMYATSWHAEASYFYTRGEAAESDSMGGDGSDTASLSFSCGGATAGVDAYPAINASETTACTAEVGGTFDDSDAAPVLMNMSALAWWTYDSTANNPYYGNGTGGAGIAASGYQIQCLADGICSLTAHVEGAGVTLTTTRSVSGVWSTTGHYTLDDGTVVTVSDNSSGAEGTSWSTGGGSPRASADASKGPLARMHNPPFSVSVSTYVDITWF